MSLRSIDNSQTLPLCHLAVFLADRIIEWEGVLMDSIFQKSTKYAPILLIRVMFPLYTYLVCILII